MYSQLFDPTDAADFKYAANASMITAITVFIYFPVVSSMSPTIVDCEYTTGLVLVNVDCISGSGARSFSPKQTHDPHQEIMLEVQGAKSLTVQRNPHKALYFKNEEFICKIHRGELYELTYAPKSDIETYMYTWKNQTLARYIKTCARYYVYVFPEFKTIEMTDKLAIHCDRRIQNAQFLFLSNFSVAFFLQPWCVRYLQAEPEETLDYSSLVKQDRKYPLHLELLMAQSLASDDEMAKKYNKVCESHKTLVDFFKIFTKRSRFKDCITWLPGIIRHETHPIYKRYKIPVLSNASQRFDSVVCTDVDYFEDSPYLKASPAEIIIRNEIIYTSGFTWADVDSVFESNAAPPSNDTDSRKDVVDKCLAVRTDT